MAKALSKNAQDLLRFARMRGSEGFPVVGIPDKLAVEELRAQGLVTEGENTVTEPSYNSRIWANEDA